MAEYIDREAIRLDEFCVGVSCQECPFLKDPINGGCRVDDFIMSFPAADVQPVKWIPFSVRDLDEEEKAEHPEWDWILEGELPENGQRILVNVKYRGHEAVQMDEYYNDDGCYLDSGYEIGTEVTHWMPLPEPPKDGET